eukprot:1836791-Pleurochrysis_carterae.AAC.1
MRSALNPIERCHKLHRNALRWVVGGAREGDAGGVHEGGEHGGDEGGIRGGGVRASEAVREPSPTATRHSAVCVGEEEAVSASVSERPAHVSPLTQLSGESVD